MRFRLTLAPWKDGNGAPILSYDYQHGVSSMIYDSLIHASEKYKDLHDSREFKFFTFSRLEVPRRRALPDGLALLSDDAYLWFSSPDAALAHTLAQNLTTTREVHFGGVRFALAGLTAVAPFTPSDHVAFRTMSPVVVRTSIDSPNGPKTWDLAPSDDEYEERLAKNLVRKYTSFHGKPPPRELQKLRVTRHKQQRIQIQDTYHRAHLMDVEMHGPPELLKFAYDCGLGEKNSMGFGMVGLGGRGE